MLTVNELAVLSVISGNQLFVLPAGQQGENVTGGAFTKDNGNVTFTSLSVPDVPVLLPVPHCIIKPFVMV